jgi:hypothetical protein
VFFSGKVQDLEENVSMNILHPGLILKSKTEKKPIFSSIIPYSATFRLEKSSIMPYF